MCYETDQKNNCYRGDGPFQLRQSNLTGGFQYHCQRGIRHVAPDDGNDIQAL